jgi:uncharacterized spore protein YtfJ
MDAKELIKEVAGMIQENANVEAVFGKPYEKGNITIIPVSKVSITGGGCGCSGKEENHNRENPLGGGLGVIAKTTPVGYIEIDNEGARFVEIIQQSKIILAGMALGAFTVFSLTRLFIKLLKKKK